MLDAFATCDPFRELAGALYRETLKSSNRPILGAKHRPGENCPRSPITLITSDDGLAQIFEFHRIKSFEHSSMQS